jgi:hypothetical protein
VSDRDGLRIALKEWAVLAQAMGDGRIVAMVRKGGIRERRAGFVVRHERFFLYPTWFHEKEAELADRFRPLLAGAHADRPPEGRIRIDLVCGVAGVWKVDELERLEGITNEHGLAPAAVASRYRYRNEPGVQVVAVRVSRLSEPVEIPEIRRYLGCVSWVALDEPIPVDGAVPVLGDAEFEERLGRLERQLGPRNDIV